MNQPAFVDPALIFDCPLCNSIPDPERESFLRDVKFTIKKFRRDDVIISQGMECSVLYILIKGEVKTEMSDEKGDCMHISIIRAPNPLAAGFLFAANNASPVTAVAKTDCTTVAVLKENVYFLMRKYEGFMMAFLLYVSNKIAFLSEKLRLVSLRTIRAKLAYYVLRESRGEKTFQLKISKEELSRLLGVTRPALVKVMMQMADEGLIDVERRKITVHDKLALQRLF